MNFIHLQVLLEPLLVGNFPEFLSFNNIKLILEAYYRRHRPQKILKIFFNLKRKHWTE